MAAALSEETTAGRSVPNVVVSVVSATPTRRSSPPERFS
jgi:hypothetical protein